jgi:hypothetical protein
MKKKKMHYAHHLNNSSVNWALRRRLDVFALFDSLLPLMSLGIAVAGGERTDAGFTTSNISEYEIFTQGYLQLPFDNVFLRPGARLGFGYNDSDGPSNPIRIFETTYKAGAELALLYSGIVVPTFSIQGFVLNRALKLSLPDNVTTNSNLMNRTEWLYSNTVSLSVGIPVFDGRVLIEPFYRLVNIDNDFRQDDLFGCEFSVSMNLQAADSL